MSSAQGYLSENLRMSLVGEEMFAVGSVASLSEPLHHHVHRVSVLGLLASPFRSHVILYTAREEHY